MTKATSPSKPAANTLKFCSPALEWQDLNLADLKDRQNVKDRLKESLLASLQMQNLVVLSGCGTSLGEVGGPSMKKLWELAIGIPASADATIVAKTIQYDMAASNNNIEDFLSQCESYLQLWDSADVKAFVNKCKSKILKECSSFINLKKLEGHKTFLHRLSRRRVRDPRLKIFTTNYDLCFETAAADLGMVVMDGFSFTRPRYYDPRFFAYDIVRRSRISEDQGSYLEGVFHLHKLHGSVNWARLEEGRIEECLTPEADKACLIYPARYKYQQSFSQPHLESISQYLSALREPNTCLIVIGFGLNDKHLSEPIFSAICSNPHLRLIIVDPAAENLLSGKGTPSSYWNKFLELSKRGEDVWFVNASFSEFADLLPDLKSLTPAEKLLKTIQMVSEKK